MPQSFYETQNLPMGVDEECPVDAFALKHNKVVEEFHGKRVNPLKTFMEASLGVSVIKVYHEVCNDEFVSSTQSHDGLLILHEVFVDLSPSECNPSHYIV